MMKDVTVYMPVYKAEHFVRTAIESVLAQSYKGFHLLISVDPSEDRSAEICSAFSHDPRVTVSINPVRLGWVGNVNACLDRLDTPFFAFCFHDDALEPAFLERLRGALDATPKAVAAFGAMQRFGTINQMVQPVDVVGTPLSRAVACMKGNFPCFSLKNLMRSAPVQQGLRLPITGDQGFAADLAFALGYSLAGDFLAVPEVLYRKSHRADSVTAGWKDIDVQQLAQENNLLRLGMIRIVQSAGLSMGDRQELVQMILAWPQKYHPPTTEDLNGLVDVADLLSPVFIIAALLDPDADLTKAFVIDQHQRTLAGARRLRLAEKFQNLGDMDAALHYAEQAVRLGADGLDAHILLARLALSRPEAQKTPALIERASFHAQRAVELNQASPVAWQLLARAQALSGNWLAVQQSAETALSLGISDPKHSESLLLRARNRLS